MTFSLEEICAAYLSDPGRNPPQELPWSSCNAQDLLKILQRNKVPLLSLGQAEQGHGLLLDPLFQTALQVEREEWTSLRTEYRQVKEVLAIQGIADVLLKSVGLAPSFPYKSDNLDVLYQPNDVERVKSVLRSLGYVELRNMEEPHKYLFRKFHAGRSISAIHVHAHVGWMVSFLDEERLWQRCRLSADDDLVTVPAAEDALLTTLAHFFYEDKSVSLWDVCKCAHCLRQGVDWDEVYRIATWRGWRDGLNVSLLLYAYLEQALYRTTLVPLEVLRQAYDALPDWTRTLLERNLGVDKLSVLCTSPGVCSPDSTTLKGSRELPLRIPFVFSKIFFYAKLLRDPTRNAARKAKDLMVHTAYGTKLRLHIHSQPSTLVTFSGVDGCGKTTQAKALQSAFEICHLRVEGVWTRGGSSPWLGWFTRLVKRWGNPFSQKKRVSILSTVQARQQSFHSRWLRWGWSWLTAIELVLWYTRRVTFPLLRGRVVIADRYVYDALADWAAYFDEAAIEKRLAARVLRWCSPRPKIAYWLDVTPEVARSRSQDDLPVQFLAQQTATYRRMAALYGLRRLEGEPGWEGISDRIVNEVLSVYFTDYHTFINTLFLKNPGQWK